MNNQAQATEAFMDGATARWRAGHANAFVRAFMGGILLSLGGVVALIIGGGMSAITAVDPGLTKLAASSVFPIGIIAIVLTGTDLVTANMATFFMSTVRGRTPLHSWFVNVPLVFFGNLAGSLFCAGIFGFYSEIFIGPYKAWAITFATTKVLAPTFGAAIVRGMACNFLVNLAIFQALLAKDVLSKIVGIFLPIFLFVACGFDHVVANMLFIPLALFLQAPTLSVRLYIVKSLIPSFIGNVFGALLIAIPLMYLHIGFVESDHSDLESGTIISHSTPAPFKKSSMDKMGGTTRVDASN